MTYAATLCGQGKPFPLNPRLLLRIADLADLCSSLPAGGLYGQSHWGQTFLCCFCFSHNSFDPAAVDYISTILRHGGSMQSSFFIHTSLCLIVPSFLFPGNPFASQGLSSRWQTQEILLYSHQLPPFIWTTMIAAFPPFGHQLTRV